MMLSMNTTGEVASGVGSHLQIKRGRGKWLNNELSKTDEASSAFTQSGRESSDRFKC